jgi:hypothetical protein
VVLRLVNPGQTGTVGAAIEGVFGLDAVANDFAPTMVANGCQLMNRTFKAVECVTRTSRNDLERHVIVVSADFTLCHLSIPQMQCTTEERWDRFFALPRDAVYSAHWFSVIKVPLPEVRFTQSSSPNARHFCEP